MGHSANAKSNAFPARTVRGLRFRVRDCDSERKVKAFDSGCLMELIWHLRVEEGTPGVMCPGLDRLVD
eukprot:325524-Rhodomonas_salina.1